MPMYDLTSDDRDDDLIRWTAGGRSRVVVYVGGDKVYSGTLQKSQRVRIAYADATGEADRD